MITYNIKINSHERLALLRSLELAASAYDNPYQSADARNIEHLLLETKPETQAGSE